MKLLIYIALIYGKLEEYIFTNVYAGDDDTYLVDRWISVMLNMTLIHKQYSGHPGIFAGIPDHTTRLDWSM
jgi:hypothetical protein